MKKSMFSWGKALPVLGVSLLAAGVLAFASSSSSAAHRGNNDKPEPTKYHLELAGVEGAADGKIELNAYRFMENEPDVDEESMTMAAQAADFGDNNLRFQAQSSKASPVLFTKATTGEQVAEGTLTVRKGKSEYLTFKMTDIVVTSYQNSANQDDQKEPLDEVVVSYATLEMTHHENENKSLKKGWDFRNKRGF